jgi:hypothetical protein
VDIAQPGQGISRDLGRGEAVEHELTAFIEERHEQRVKSEGETGAAGCRGIGAWSAATWSVRPSADGGRRPCGQTQQPNRKKTRHE